MVSVGFLQPSRTPQLADRTRGYQYLTSGVDVCPITKLKKARRSNDAEE
jgi:hypothetical protein